MDTGFPRELSGKESACQARDSDSIPGLWNPLEEEMGTLSSIFDWKISDRGACGLYKGPRGHRRVGHDLATKTITTAVQYVDTMSSDGNGFISLCLICIPFISYCIMSLARNF